MNKIQTVLTTPTPLTKAVATAAGLLAITLVVLAIIRLSAPQGPFNMIAHLGALNNGLLLSASLIGGILTAGWMTLLFKKRDGTHPETPAVKDPSQKIFPVSTEPQTPQLTTDSIGEEPPLNGLRDGTHPETPAAKDPSRQEIFPVSAESQTPQLTTDSIGEEPPLNGLTDELLLQIFSFLDAETVGRLSQTCLRMRGLGNDKSLLAPLLVDVRILGPEVWKNKYPDLEIDFSDLPPLQLNDLAPIGPQLRRIHTLKVRDNEYSRGDSENKKFTLFPVPKNLTLRKFAEAEKVRLPLTNPLSQEMLDTPTANSYYLLITNNGIIQKDDGSAFMTLLKPLATAIECLGFSIPSCLEICVFCKIIARQNGGSMYYGNPSTWLTASPSEEVYMGFCAGHFGAFNYQEIASILPRVYIGAAFRITSV